MASGDVVGYIHGISFPNTTPATPDIRVGAASGSTENFVVYDFDDAQDEFLDFHGSLHGYDGGGLTVLLRWMATSATSGTCRWGAAFRAIPDDAEDVDTTAHSYDYNTTGATAASATGEFAYDSLTFTDGADMDSLADGESFVLRITRDGNGTSGTDDMSGDAELVEVIITET